MEKYDVVIIGSGLGGLQCAYILSKHGMNVCVLEKNAQPGGCLQSFRRGRHTFDTGFHYVGGLDEGQPLHRLFDYFGLLDLPWHRMDENGFDEVVLHDKSYLLANGYERFAEMLSQQFPHQRENLKRYTQFLEQVSAGIFNAFTGQSEEDVYGKSLFAQPAYDYLVSTIDDPLLRQVLSGSSLKMELNPQTLPLYTFAQINSSYIQSAWRLRGGGSQIADVLIKRIEANGGTVRLNAEVTRLIEEDGKIVAAEINGSSPVVGNGYDKNQTAGNDVLSRPSLRGTKQSSSLIITELQNNVMRGDYFISDIHPSATLSLITESKLVRNIYRKRINNLQNTFGMFTTHITWKENTIPYQNRNMHVYETGDVWQYAVYNPENVNTCALVSYQPPQPPQPPYNGVNNNQTAVNDSSTYPLPGGEGGASCMDILTPMYPQEVEQWSKTRTGHRGDEYLSYKKQKAEACIRFVSKHIPGLKNMVNPTDAIDNIHTSTSLTYRDYTGTPCGSAYGIRKNCKQLMTTLLSPRTPEPNLFLTGQNLNLHGVLGVSITSFLTCAEMIDMKEEVKKFTSSE